MDYVEVMEISDALKKVTHEESHLSLPKSCFLGLPPVDQLLQSASPDELHLDEQVLISLMEGIKLDNIFMVHGFQDLSLLKEGSDPRLIHALFLDDLYVTNDTLTAYYLFLW